MSAAGRFLLLALCVTLALMMALALLVSGPADAQTSTTVAPIPAAPVAATTAVAVTTTVPKAGDAASTRTVNRIVAVLVGLAVVLLGVAVWFWRSTKPVPRHLDGLDLMGTRPWQDADPGGRSALLAPVHERRGEERDDDLIAPPEHSEAPAAAAEDPEVAVVDEVAVVPDEFAVMPDEVAVVPDEVAVVDDPPEVLEAPTAPRVS